MGASGSTLLPAPDERLIKCIKLLELSNTDLANVFAMFCKHDTSQRGCLSLANVYKMLTERKSIFGDSVFELIGEATKLAKMRSLRKSLKAGSSDVIA